MIRDGYVARWRARDYEASPNGDEVRLYAPTADDGFDEIRAGRHRRIVPVTEIDDLWYVRTTCTWQGQPFIVLAEHDSWLRVEYTGGKAPVAGELGLEEFDYGVYQGWAAAGDVTELREQRV